MGDTLDIWTITESPTDHPGKFVSRKHVVKAGEAMATHEHFVCDSLDDARAAIPQRLFRIPRSRGDDPVIVESWL